jgi:PAS domain S-box-containing protein
MQVLTDILDRVSDGFVALDKNWCYTYVNQQAAGLFGRRPEDLVGRHIWTEFPEGRGQPFHLAYEKAMADQVFIHVESYYEPCKRWFENRIYPSPEGLSIFFHEITERKLAEQAAHENAALLAGQNRVLELIARGASLRESLDTLLRVMEAQCSGMLCSILLLDSDGIHVRHGAAPSLPDDFIRGIDGQVIGPQAGSCGTAAFRRETVVVEDIATDPLWESYRPAALAHGLRACWSTPIFDGRRAVLGTFALYFPIPTRPSERQLRMVDLCTHMAAIAIVKDRETRALLASEERQRLAASSGHIGIWEWNLGSDRLLWSDELKAMFGWPTATTDLTFEMVMSAVHPDDRAQIRDSLQRALAGGATYREECRIIRPDGSVRWIATTGRGEYDTAGVCVRMRGVSLDVTDRKQADEEISRREAQLAEAQRIAHLGSYEWDVHSNTVERSEELCRIFGVALDQFPPTLEGYLERVHPDDRHVTRSAIETAFQQGTPFEFEERILRPDGTVRMLHSQGTWIVDTAGRPMKLVGICQDITERKRAEDEIRRSEERFQMAARATNDVIWDWDLTNGTVWWNRGITSVFNYGPDDVVDSADWIAANVHPDDLDTMTKGLREVMAAGGVFWSGEYRFRRADGSYADVCDRAFVIYDSARTPVRVIGAMADISERKRAVELLEQRVASRTGELRTKNEELEYEVKRRAHVERLLRARNEELKAFAYTVSHDLKAPLRGIAGYAAELDRRHRSGLSERALHCVRQIVTATHNLDRLIEDLLHYSRLDSETPSPTTVNLTHTVEVILRDRNTTILEQGAHVAVSLTATIIHTWERGLLQVLTNLIDNALKYSRNVHPSLIRIASHERGEALLIEVADNGIGFDMKYHDRMFGLFDRLVRQEDFEGTGAGLAIVKKLLDKMGGRIWAESAPGAGATFFVELPLRAFGPHESAP